MERFEVSTERFGVKEDEEESQPKEGHSLWRAFIILAHVAVLIVTVTINYLGNSLVAPEGLFNSSVGNVSRKYPNTVTPSGWTFSIWGAIYAWQLLHSVYSMTLLCRRQKDGRYLYTKSGHVHFSFYLVYMFNNVLITGWLFLFDREYIFLSFIFLCLICITLYICGIILCVYLDKAGAYLESSGNSKEIWFTRMFLLNGIAFYATWCTIATLLSFATTMIHREGVDADIAAWVSLSILAAAVILWFVLETFVFDKQLRYCFSQHTVLVVALVGILTKNFKPSSPKLYYIFVIVLLVLVGLLAMVKVGVMFVRGRKFPIKYSE